MEQPFCRLDTDDRSVCSAEDPIVLRAGSFLRRLSLGRKEIIGSEGGDVSSKGMTS